MEEDQKIAKQRIGKGASKDAAPSPWIDWLTINGEKLLLFARQQTRSIHDAEDVLQQALIKLARKIEEKTFVGDQGSWLPYMYTQIRRESIDLGRKEDRRRIREYKATDEESIRTPWFEASSNHDDSNEILTEALQEIPEKFAEVITMKIWGEQTFAQISEILDISLNTAASRYRYGLEALNKKLKASRDSDDL